MTELLELTASDWFTITGRGRVAAVDLRQLPDCPARINSESELPVHVGEHVRIDGRKYKISGIELSRALMSPPFIKPGVGLIVQEIK